MASRFAAATALLFIASSAFAEPDKNRVKASIRAGQEFLRAVYKPGGPGPGGLGRGGMVPGAMLMAPIGGTGNGPTALAGLALLESGAGAGDPAVMNITKVCREVCLETESTYEVALMIMFLDRLGSPADEGLIQFLTLRLMTGQTGDGSWSYSCAGLPLNPVERAQLRLALRESKMVTPDGIFPKKDKPKPREDIGDGAKPAKKDPPPAPKDAPKEERPRGMHPALDKFAPKAGGNAGFLRAGSGDHSNTQFATVGLWCGRRHNVPVNDALAALDKHYRDCQQGDGGWSYVSAGGTSTPSMTCAGLMGLAIGFGAKNLKEGADRQPRLENPEALEKDPKVMSGLKYLGDAIAGAKGNEGLPNNLTKDLYFMWSMERVGMVYGINMIEKVDWYDWGANVLMRTQNRDGTWASDGAHSGSVDSATAFAILFLSRANLAADLTTSLKGRAKDPDKSQLVRDPDPSKPIDGGRAGTKKSDGGPIASIPPTPKVDLPAANVDTGAKLVNALIAAGPFDRDDLIAKYRDTKGGDYTDALARSAAKLTGSSQTKVREALAQRLTRMTANTLNDFMRDGDRELRRAAALAAGSKGKDRLAEFADSLILLIADLDADVVQAARASLRALTDQDFGPEAGAVHEERTKMAAAWRAWWNVRKK